MEDFKIIFSGSLIEGFDLDNAKNSFSSLFKLTDQGKLDQIFSGKSVAIKKSLSAEKAIKFKERLNAIGMAVEIQPPVNEVPLESSLSLLSLDEEKSVTPDFSVEKGEVKFQIPDAQEEIQAKQMSLISELKEASGKGFSGLSLEPIEAKAEPEQESEQNVMSKKLHQTAELKKPRAQSAIKGSAAVAAASLTIGNSSGSGKGAVLPDEAKGLCWGAFFLSFFWGLRNKVYVSFLALIPYVNLVVVFYLLFKGRELSWQKQRWESVEEFNKSQKIWGWVGFIFGLVPFILLTMFVSSMNDELDKLENMTEEERSAYEQQQTEQLNDAINDIEDPELKKQMEEFQKQMEEMKKKQKKN